MKAESKPELDGAKEIMRIGRVGLAGRVELY